MSLTLNHIVVNVKDAEAIVAFNADILGLPTGCLEE